MRQQYDRMNQSIFIRRILSGLEWWRRPMITFLMVCQSIAVIIKSNVKRNSANAERLKSSRESGAKGIVCETVVYNVGAMTISANPTYIAGQSAELHNPHRALESSVSSSFLPYCSQRWANNAIQHSP
jgi:hypothetical protein